MKKEEKREKAHRRRAQEREGGRQRGGKRKKAGGRGVAGGALESKQEGKKGQGPPSRAGLRPEQPLSSGVSCSPAVKKLPALAFILALGTARISGAVLNKSFLFWEIASVLLLSNFGIYIFVKSLHFY